MKLFVSMFLLAGATTLTIPAQAQQAAGRPAVSRAAKPVASQPAVKTTGTTAAAPNAKLTWQQRRAIKRKKVTPYAQAVLNNELLREQPAKSNENGVF